MSHILVMWIMIGYLEKDIRVPPCPKKCIKICHVVPLHFKTFIVDLNILSLKPFTLTTLICKQNYSYLVYDKLIPKSTNSALLISRTEHTSCTHLIYCTIKISHSLLQYQSDPRFNFILTFLLMKTFVLFAWNWVPFWFLCQCRQQHLLRDNK